ncbi:MAG: hypothetical protein IKY38_02970 [Anaerotignum sp.]|nr:hypothetical protein [Anaerotignum sp.]
MHQPISRKDLCGYLSLLRKTMGETELFPAPNVIYLNNRALYHQLANIPCGDDTIGGILQKIETCLPLAVTKESFALFLSACKEPDAERTRSFLESSKADFLLMIHQTTKDEEQWSALTDLCENLRQKNKR